MAEVATELARAKRDEKCWRDALVSAVARAKRFEEALAFYADAASYENATPRTVRPVIADGGAVAREALGDA